MNEFEKYYQDFLKLSDDFHDNMKNYPLFENMLDDMDKDLDEINELLEKNDLFYLKKAIDKLEIINKFIVDTSKEITQIYHDYNDKSNEWSKLTIKEKTSKDLIDKANDYILKANSLIKEKDLNKIRRALTYLEDAIKLLK